MFLDRLPLALGKVPFRRFLMVGQRWDLDVQRQLNFNNPGWKQGLLDDVRQHGHLRDQSWLDYFAFCRG